MLIAHCIAHVMKSNLFVAINKVHMHAPQHTHRHTDIQTDTQMADCNHRFDYSFQFHSIAISIHFWIVFTAIFNSAQWNVSIESVERVKMPYGRKSICDKFIIPQIKICNQLWVNKSIEINRRADKRDLQKTNKITTHWTIKSIWPNEETPVVTFICSVGCCFFACLRDSSQSSL